MNKHYTLAANCLVILSVISFNIFASKISAQESIDSLDRPKIPLDDQVRFIDELESRSSNQWDFAIGQVYLTENAYQLQIAKPSVPVRFIEQDKPKWDHTGQAPKYSIMFDIYGDSREPQLK